MSPNINDITIPRKSEDKTTNGRAPWLIQLCELQGWTIVNGRQPGTPARHTFARGNVKSCLDLILTNTSTSNVEYDPDTLNGLSDHTMIMTKVHTAYFRR
jgi:Endonuclease-reverse transcriptase